MAVVKYSEGSSNESVKLRRHDSSHFLHHRTVYLRSQMGCLLVVPQTPAKKYQISLSETDFPDQIESKSIEFRCF